MSDYKRLTDLLNEMNTSGKLEYDDYSLLFDMASDLEILQDKIEQGKLVEVDYYISEEDVFHNPYYIYTTIKGGNEKVCECKTYEQALAKLKEIENE